MKWYTYIICFLLIIAGVFCGTSVFMEMSEESYINGSIDITNSSTQESFYYSNSSLVFYNDIYDETETYYYTIDLTAIEDFDGLNKDYDVYVNGYEIFDESIYAGRVECILNLTFYNTDAESLDNAALNIKIEFLADKSTLTIYTTTYTSATYLESYFENNGLLIKINENI